MAVHEPGRLVPADEPRRHDDRLRHAFRGVGHAFPVHLVVPGAGHCFPGDFNISCQVEHVPSGRLPGQNRERRLFLPAQRSVAACDNSLSSLDSRIYIVLIGDRIIRPLFQDAALVSDTDRRLTLCSVIDGVADSDCCLRDVQGSDILAELYVEADLPAGFVLVPGHKNIGRFFGVNCECVSLLVQRIELVFLILFPPGKKILPVISFDDCAERHLASGFCIDGGRVVTLIPFRIRSEMILNVDFEVHKTAMAKTINDIAEESLRFSHGIDRVFISRGASCQLTIVAVPFVNNPLFIVRVHNGPERQRLSVVAVHVNGIFSFFRSFRIGGKPVVHRNVEGNRLSVVIPVPDFTGIFCLTVNGRNRISICICAFDRIIIIRPLIGQPAHIVRFRDYPERDGGERQHRNFQSVCILVSFRVRSQMVLDHDVENSFAPVPVLIRYFTGVYLCLRSAFDHEFILRCFIFCPVLVAPFISQAAVIKGFRFYFQCDRIAETGIKINRLRAIYRAFRIRVQFIVDIERYIHLRGVSVLVPDHAPVIQTLRNVRPVGILRRASNIYTSYSAIFFAVIVHFLPLIGDPACICRFRDHSERRSLKRFDMQDLEVILYAVARGIGAKPVFCIDIEERFRTIAMLIAHIAFVYALFSMLDPVLRLIRPFDRFKVVGYVFPYVFLKLQFAGGPGIFELTVLRRGNNGPERQRTPGLRIQTSGIALVFLRSLGLYRERILHIDIEFEAKLIGAIGDNAAISLPGLDRLDLIFRGISLGDQLPVRPGIIIYLLDAVPLERYFAQISSFHNDPECQRAAVFGTEGYGVITLLSPFRICGAEV